MSCASGVHVVWVIDFIDCSDCGYTGGGDVIFSTCDRTTYVTCPGCGREWEGVPRDGYND